MHYQRIRRSFALLKADCSFWEPRKPREWASYCSVNLGTPPSPLDLLESWGYGDTTIKIFEFKRLICKIFRIKDLGGIFLVSSGQRLWGMIRSEGSGSQPLT